MPTGALGRLGTSSGWRSLSWRRLLWAYVGLQLSGRVLQRRDGVVLSRRLVSSVAGTLCPPVRGSIVARVLLCDQRVWAVASAADELRLWFGPVAPAGLVGARLRGISAFRCVVVLSPSSC